MTPSQDKDKNKWQIKTNFKYMYLIFLSAKQRLYNLPTYYNKTRRNQKNLWHGQSWGEGEGGEEGRGSEVCPCNNLCTWYFQFCHIGD